MGKYAIILRIPKTLLQHLNNYKDQKEFSTRIQDIFHLLNVAPEQPEDQNRK